MQDPPSDPVAVPLYRFHAQTARWQMLAIRLATESSIDSLIPAVRQAIADAPRDGTVAERVVARSVLNEILARLVRKAGLERDPEIGAALLALLTSCRSEDWSREAQALVDHCAQPDAPLLVRRALKMLDERFGEQHLDVSVVASALMVSTSHLCHQLAKYTGRSFKAHLHLRRTTAAFERLQHTRETFDAIATAVGFSDETQLRRHIQRRFGTTPRGLRVGMRVSETHLPRLKKSVI